MTAEKIKKIQAEIDAMSAEKVVKWAMDNFELERIALASSLSIEDQVLADMLLKLNPKAQVFTLDTGRLFPESYDVMDRNNLKYKAKMLVLFPEREDVEEMVKEYGPNLFYDSIDNRKLCCDVRKVRPLKRMLSCLDAWITGLRREQSVTRTDIHKIEWDEGNGIVKLNPIADWTEEQTRKYIQANNVPYNKLQDQGFRSLGCAPCTRAISDDEDLRNGRWWWENPEHKECGLHVKK